MFYKYLEENESRQVFGEVLPQTPRGFFDSLRLEVVGNKTFFFYVTNVFGFIDNAR